MSLIENAIAGYKPKRNGKPQIGAAHQLSFLVPTELKERLTAYAQRNGQSGAVVVRIALDKFLPPMPPTPMPTPHTPDPGDEQPEA